MPSQPTDPNPSDLAPDFVAAAFPLSVSGTYEGELAGGRSALVLRVDIDPRSPTSPVTHTVSGDVYKIYRVGLPGKPPRSFRVYTHSFIVRNPTVQKGPTLATIQGAVEFWSGNHPSTLLTLTIATTTPGTPGPARAEFSDPDEVAEYICQCTSRCFREVTLEIDVCKSVPGKPLLPTYPTHTHPNHPSIWPRWSLWGLLADATMKGLQKTFILVKWGLSSRSAVPLLLDL